MQAGMLMPEHGIFDFFKQEAEALSAHVARATVPTGGTLSTEERLRISELQNVTSEGFLLNKQKEVYSKKEKKPVVDDEKIRDTIEFMIKTQQYAEVNLCSQISGEHPDDVVRVLKILGYNESRIKGRYIK